MISSQQVQEAIPGNGFLSKYIRWAGRWIDSAEPFHLVSALALLAQTFPEGYGLPSGSYPLRANFYGLMVGPSRSAGKSEAVNAATSVLEVALPACYVADKPASSASAIKLLTGTNQLIFYPEFGMFLGESDVGQFRSIRDTYTDFYDCRVQSRVRREEVERDKGRKKTPVEPRWSILGGSAPGFLEDYTKPRDWNSGFLARFYTIYADRSEITVPKIAPEKDQERERIAKILKAYACVERPLDPFNYIAPPQNCEGFTDEAAGRFKSHLEMNQERARKVPEYAQTAIDGAKGHVLKLALLVAWDTGEGRSGDPWRISLDDMEHAIAIDELRIQSVTEIVEGLAVDFDQKNERRFLRVLEGGEALPFGEIIRRAQLGMKRGAEARDSLRQKGEIEATGEHTEKSDDFWRIPRSNVVAISGSKAVKFFNPFAPGEEKK